MTQMDMAVLRTHPLFSFGTLQDNEVFDVVTGGLSLEQVPRQTAWLPDHRVVNAIDGPHPVLQPAAGEWAPGLLFHSLPDTAIDRIAWFEWPEFRVDRKTVSTKEDRLPVPASCRSRPGLPRGNPGRSRPGRRRRSRSCWPTPNS
ncbi:gamma-glutamylcyclotransferase family protein [Fodinicurvata fenggangensis]|uniref:gamma-glutamylcyclotransferase family protein n=1 Tax=Fodinicurvata fenggangensis TaxID=1121830 RepID=UPI0009DD0EB4